jgi:hypothetical protein
MKRERVGVLRPRPQRAYAHRGAIARRLISPGFFFDSVTLKVTAARVKMGLEEKL